MLNELCLLLSSKLGYLLTGKFMDLKANIKSDFDLFCDDTDEPVCS